VSAGKPGNFPKVPGMMAAPEEGHGKAVGIETKSSPHQTKFSEKAKKFDVKIQHGLECEKAHKAFASLTASVRGAQLVTAALETVANQLTAEGQDFISKKIAKLREEGMEEAQASAAAYSMAREAGYEVPEQK
jgi:hypothetical protein